MKTVYAVYQIIDYEECQIAICMTLTKAEDYCRKQLEPSFTKNKDGSIYVSCPTQSYYIREKELVS